MKQIVSGKTLILRIDKGEKLNATLLNFLNNSNISSAAFSAIGACEELELGFYNLDSKEYQWKTFADRFEIVSLTGNISKYHDEKILHMHGVFSDINFHTIGGHVKDFTVSATCEVEIRLLDENSERTEDKLTGLKLLS